MTIIKSDPVERFMSYAHPEPNSGCWLWRAGCFDRSGYGNFYQSNGRSIVAHRYSWLIHRGPIPAKTYVCHKCDTPSCVNPDHLFLGTPKQNSDDMVSKGRQARGTHVGRGRGVGLTEAQVIEIKKNRDIDAKVLAILCQVDESTIRSIRRGETWGWL